MLKKTIIALLKITIHNWEAMSMKKILYLAILGMLVFAFTGCAKKDTMSYDYDYNQEPMYNQNLAWTPKGIYTISNQILYYISPGGKNTVLCSKPECKHKGKGCEAYIEADNLFVFNHKLCYTVLDEKNHQTTVYTMNDKGKERKKYFTVTFPNDFKKEMEEGNMGSSTVTSSCGNIYIQEINMMTDTISKSRTYCIDLRKPSKSRSIDTKSMGGGGVLRIGKEWVIFGQFNPQTNESSIWGYNIKSKENRVFVNRTNFTFERDWVADVKMKGDTLYWYEYGLGFCKKNIKEEQDPNQKTVVFSLKQDEWLGNGIMGKDYLVLCNMKSPVNPIPDEKQGISFYSYDGKLIQFVPTINQDYQYFMETEDKFYFIDRMETKSADIPAAYIDKSALEEGNGTIIKMK